MKIGAKIHLFFNFLYPFRALLWMMVCTLMNRIMNSIKELKMVQNLIMVIAILWNIGMFCIACVMLWLNVIWNFKILYICILFWWKIKLFSRLGIGFGKESRTFVMLIMIAWFLNIILKLLRIFRKIRGDMFNLWKNFWENLNQILKGLFGNLIIF